MKTGFLLFIAAVVGAIWYFRKNAKQTPLQMHFAELENQAAVGTAANASAFMSQPPLAMLGEGWATTMQVNIANPRSIDNVPAPTRFGFRYAQP